MLRDSLLVFCAQGVGIILALALNAILVRFLSIEDFGYFQLVLSYIFLFSFVSLPGFTKVNIKGAAKGIDSVLHLSYRYSLLGSFFGFAGCLIAGGLLYFISELKILGFLFMVGSVHFPLFSLNLFDSFLIGKRRFDISRILMVINSLMGLVFVGAVAFLTKSLAAVFITATIVKIMYVLTGFFKTNKIIQRQKLEEGDRRYYIKYGLRMTLLGILWTVSNQLEKIILGTLNPSYLSYYFVGALIPKKLRDNSKALLSVPTTYWIKLSRVENEERVKRYWWVFVGIGFICFVTLYFGSPLFIPLIFGERFTKSIWVTQWLSTSIVFVFLQLMISNIAIYQGDEAFFTKISIIGSVLKISLFLILIPLYKVHGVVISIVGTELFVFLIALLWFLKNIKVRDKLIYAES